MTRNRTGMLRLTPEQFEVQTTKARRAAFNEGARGRVVATEAETQDAVLHFLRLHPAVAWAHRFNTGSGYLINARLYKELVAQGVLKPNDARFMQFGFPGCPDVLGMLRGGRLLAVEVKGDGGKLTDEQAAALEGINGGGGLGLVVYRLEDVADALR